MSNYAPNNHMSYRNNLCIIECDSSTQPLETVDPIGHIYSIEQYIEYLGKSAKCIKTDKRFIKNEKK